VILPWTGSIQTYDRPHVPREPNHGERRRPHLAPNQRPACTNRRRCDGPLHTLPVRGVKRLQILREVRRHEDNPIHSKRHLWTVCEPRALYANSHVSRFIPYFNDPKATRQTAPTRGHFFNPFSFLPRDDNSVPSCGEHKENLETGKVTKIQDMAFGHK